MERKEKRRITIFYSFFHYENLNRFAYSCLVPKSNITTYEDKRYTHTTVTEAITLHVL
jgi:hypothetical protein